MRISRSRGKRRQSKKRIDVTKVSALREYVDRETGDTFFLAQIGRSRFASDSRYLSGKNADYVGCEVSDARVVASTFHVTIEFANSAKGTKKIRSALDFHIRRGNLSRYTIVENGPTASARLILAPDRDVQPILVSLSREKNSADNEHGDHKTMPFVRVIQSQTAVSTSTQYANRPSKYDKRRRTNDKLISDNLLADIHCPVEGFVRQPGPDGRFCGKAPKKI